MLEHLRSLQQALTTVRSVVAGAPGARVARGSVKEAARSLVNGYFRERRRALVDAGVSDEILRPLDARMQGLLRLAQGRSSKNAYLESLKSIRDDLNVLEVALVTGTSGPDGNAIPGADPRDRRVLETMGRLCPSAAASYRQGLADLSGPDRVSWRGTATEFREALRETLDHLASDEDVQRQPGFRLETGRAGPTMAQNMPLSNRNK